MSKATRRLPHETAGVNITLGGVTASPPKKDRNREWEGKQRQDPDKCVLTFRYQPRQIKDRINAIAEQKGVIRDEVARKLLEYALAEYEKGRLPLQAILKSGRLTFFPEERGDFF